ncbi:MAG: DUF3592 domain-containing protein [Lentisphaerae bacterium]|nr:DUF3592 domain-containing protein [Lentisphaerota bacterium]
MIDALIPALSVLVPGVIVVAIGLLDMAFRVRFLRRACRTWGTVQSMEERYPSGPFQARGVRSIPSYLPKIQFVTEDGLRYEFVEYAISRFLSPQVGRKIAVAYDPHAPQKACIVHWLTLWARPVSITMFGIFVCFLGVHLL